MGGGGVDDRRGEYVLHRREACRVTLTRARSCFSGQSYP
jgi:hypothetical protein